MSDIDDRRKAVNIFVTNFVLASSDLDNLFDDILNMICGEYVAGALDFEMVFSKQDLANILNKTTNCKMAMLELTDTLKMAKMFSEK